MTKEEQRNIFIEHFQKQIENINSISCDNESLFKKTLYLNMIDALSKVATYPKNHELSVKFANTIKRFGNWEECDKISLPSLNYRLQNKKNSSLHGYIEPDNLKSMLEKWPIKSPIKIELNHDLNFESLKHSKILKNGKELDNNIKKHQHVSLLWKYRCCLTHSFDEPVAVHEENIEYPYYHGVLLASSHDKRHEIRLCYPINFLKKLTETITSNLGTFLKEKDISPHKAFNYQLYCIDRT